MEHNEVLAEYQDILRNYPLTKMTKSWNPVIPAGSGSELMSIEKLFQLVEKSQTLTDLATSKAVQAILKEIGLGRSMPIIRMFGLLIEHMLKKMHMAVLVNRRQVEEIKRSLPKNPVIYLPSHRSYADFIIFSYLCFYLDLEVPTVAAGIDFKDMKGLGRLMNHASAFFMRRKFGDDKQYWYVFKEFIRRVVTSYNSGVEFFLEGTRSRTMKALQPKIGLLSMSLEPLFMGQVIDITIIPISISYERPLEEQLFAYELLGVPKPKESTLRFLESLFSVGDRYFGRLYCHYHTPISVKEFFGDRLNRFQHANEPAHVQQLTGAELAMVQELADHVLDLQQRHIVIHTFNLIAMYLSLHNQTQGLTREPVTLTKLCDQVLLFAWILGRLGAPTNVDPSRIREDVEATLKVHYTVVGLSKAKALASDGVHVLSLTKPFISTHQVSSVKFKAHRLMDVTMRECVPIVTLQIYVNPCLYWTAGPALMTLAVMKLTETEIEHRTYVRSLREEMSRLRKIFHAEFVFNEKLETVDFDRTLNQLQNFNFFAVCNTKREEIRARPLWMEDNGLSRVLLATVSPYICAYYQVARMIAENFQNVEFEDRECLTKVQANVERELNLRERHVHPYCLCLETMATALNTMVKMNVLAGTKKGSTEERVLKVTDEQGLRDLVVYLKRLCTLLPFNYLQDYDETAVCSSKL